jgi:membrane-bound metal-dependent hydrolase YbcI (DUF457 family)
VFIGHFAVAFAAKRIAPTVSLGTLFLAAQLADLIWPALVLSGIEIVAIRPGITAMTPLDFIHYPYSHSLLALAAWSVLLGGAWLLRHRPAATAALVITAVALSHWLLDVISHRPDMPLTLAGPTRLGFGLWNSIPATLVVEGLMFAIGVALYARGTAARNRIGRNGLVALVAFLALVYLAGAFGPPPPSPAAVAWTAQAIWLLVAWAYWVDRNRSPLRFSTAEVMA